MLNQQFDIWLEQAEDEAWSAKVLSNYILVDKTSELPRLKDIPATRKKRLVILKWLVSHFDQGTNYSEAKVNEILKQFHPDCATLRREMIGYNLMQRESGIYWRQT
ncbi:MAG: DUF2087 domain-containing protein [Calothrix sp. FI2-JRJ7]|jgi:hypothetical protein|nr:DUF2087 domain-containing protein [Calothrix sp. FI2-JRJ7]